MSSVSVQLQFHLGSPQTHHYHNVSNDKDAESSGDNVDSSGNDAFASKPNVMYYNNLTINLDDLDETAEENINLNPIMNL